MEASSASNGHACPPFQLQDQEGHNSRKPPPRYLPPEVVAEVLKLSLPPVMDLKARRRFSTLRSVSKSWRQTAFSTPALWAGIHVACLPIGRSQLNAQAIDRWYDRAGECPLTFTVVVNNCDYRQVAEVVETLMVATSNRHWHRIDIQISPFIMGRLANPTWQLMSAVYESPFVPWRRLKDLSLPIDMLIGNGRSQLLNFLQVCAPGLTIFRPGLICIPVHDLGPVVHPNLQALDLEFEKQYYQSILEFCTLLPNLQHLLLDVDPLGPRAHHPSLPVTLPGLKTLKLGGCPSNLLRSITLPSLVSLQVDNSMGQTDLSEEADTWVDFLRRSSCPLVDVAMEHILFTDIELARILRTLSKIPSMETLAFSSGSLIQQLTCSVPGQEWDETSELLLFPSLRSIRVFGQVPDFDLHFLADYLEERESDLASAYPQSDAKGRMVRLDLHPRFGAESTIFCAAWDAQVHRESLARLRKLNVEIRINGRCFTEGGK